MLALGVTVELCEPGHKTRGRRPGFSCRPPPPRRVTRVDVPPAFGARPMTTSDEATRSVSRRGFISRTAVTGLGIALVGSVDTLFGAGSAAAAPGGVPGRPGTRGPVQAGDRVRPAGRRPAGRLALPRGFRYTVVTQAGVTTLESGVAHARATTTAPARSPARRRHRAGQQPRDPRAVRHRAARAAPGRADLRPGRRRRLHGRRGRPRRATGSARTSASPARRPTARAA